MVGPPELRYAHNDGFALAYQVLGDGPDLIYLPGWVSNVEGNWLAPDHARFLERLSSFSRTIVVDRRGTGCSDRLPPGEAMTLEEGVEDLRMVAREAHSSRPALFGVQEGGFYALLAAATHPERFTKLILFGAAHTWRKTSETPWQWSDEDFEDNEAAFSGPGLSEVAQTYIRYAPAFVRRRCRRGPTDGDPPGIDARAGLGRVGEPEAPRGGPQRPAAVDPCPDPRPAPHR